MQRFARTSVLCCLRAKGVSRCICTSSVCPDGNAADCRAAKDVAALLDAHPDAAQRVVERLSPNRRRYFLVAAVAGERFGPRCVSSKVDQVDADGDAKISATEYTAFIEETVTSKQSVSWWVLLLVALHAGAPFVAFGFLDNSLMILSGDAIDATFGERLALSAMGAAALGGVCSGTLGIQVHGAAERLIKYLGIIPSPRLTHHQLRNPLVFRATHLGGTIGIMVGLCLGMTPLLFLSHSSGHSTEALNFSEIRTDTVTRNEHARGL